MAHPLMVAVAEEKPLSETEAVPLALREPVPEVVPLTVSLDDTTAVAEGEGVREDDGEPVALAVALALPVNV